MDQPLSMNELATQLSAVEDWLREHCEARHAEDMADIVLRAYQIIEDLVDAETAADPELPADVREWIRTGKRPEHWPGTWPGPDNA